MGKRVVSNFEKVVGGWYRPAWSDSMVWSPPPVRKIRTIENIWIAMPDGVKLAARLFLPEDAEQAPVGAVLEYIPYHKRTDYRSIDDRTAAWLVPRGFAYVRVDVRGTGESEGLICNEYDLPEQADAAPLIRWISQQPWCNGNVGMRGASYGAINSFQAAAKGIPELKAIVPAVGTENGYTDDVHTLGGCVINEKVIWGTIWKQIMIDPPDPELVGERWRTMWLERLHAQIPMVAEWMQHQLVDQYWHDRILTDYSRIQCGVYVLGGLMDSYVNTVPRVLEQLNCPRKGLVGPWGHSFPGNGNPGPRLDWAFEEARWWDYWLNNHDNGIMDEPMLRTYIADATVAQTYPADTPGRWVSEERWPAQSIKSRRFFVTTQNTLQPDQPPIAHVTVLPLGTIGGCIPLLSPSDMATHAATEQSDDDKLSLVFETEPLEENIDIVGQPVVHLGFTADKPVAKLAARLNEVTPDGRSWMLTYGVQNLAHNDDHTGYEPIRPGVERHKEMVLYYTSRRVQKGSRLRLSFSQSQWPIVWPSPEPVELQLITGKTALEIPVRTKRERETPIPVEIFPDKSGATPAQQDPSSSLVQAEGKTGSRRVSLVARYPVKPRMIKAINMSVGIGWSVNARMTEGDANSYRIELKTESVAQREGWKVLTKVDTTMTSTCTEFIVNEGIEAWHNGKKLFAKRWNNRVKRNGN